MFLERLVLFLVLGFFVFSPTVGSWLNVPLPDWYRLYVPWLFVIGICAWLHLDARRKGDP